MIWWVWESLKYSWWESSDRWFGNRKYVVMNASRMETRRRARRGVSPFWSWWEVRASGLGRDEEVVRRGAEVGWDARCCVKAATRRLLEEQLVVVAILWNGKKSDATWHVPHYITLASLLSMLHLLVSLITMKHYIRLTIINATFISITIKNETL